MYPLQGQAGGSRRVPDLGCEQDGEKQYIPFLRLPHVCASRCEAGHCREGEGRLSCLGQDELYGCVVAVCLKFPCTARHVVRSRDREFYDNNIKCLTECRQDCAQNDGKVVEKYPRN
jgi:hypothetical protein